MKYGSPLASLWEARRTDAVFLSLKERKPLCIRITVVHKAGISRSFCKMNKTPSHTANFIIHTRFVSSQNVGAKHSFALKPQTASNKAQSAGVASALYLISFCCHRSRVRRAGVRAGLHKGTSGARGPDAAPGPGPASVLAGAPPGARQKCEGAVSQEPLPDARLHRDAVAPGPGPTGAAPPREGAGASDSASMGLERRPDARSQGLRRGALCGAAHGQALRGQGVGCGGPNGHELQGEDRGASVHPQGAMGSGPVASCLLGHHSSRESL